MLSRDCLICRVGCLEPFMKPEILIWLSTDCRFHQTVNDTPVLFIIAAGVVSQHFAEINVVSGVVGATVMTEKTTGDSLNLAKRLPAVIVAARLPKNGTKPNALRRSPDPGHTRVRDLA